MGGGVVGCTRLAAVGIDTCHELCLHVCGQCGDDVYALSVLALRVEDIDCLVAVDEHAGVAHLSAHLTVERCVVEHQLVERLLLLSDLAVAHDAALVFSVVVAYELLLALFYDFPVAVLDGCGVAGARLLLLHLNGESFLVNGVSVLAADELCKVKGEAVGVEQAEGLPAVEPGLAVGLQLVHGGGQEADALVERAQERVFLFLHHTADKLALRLQLGIGAAHLAYEHGQQLVHERLLLSEERVGIAHGTAQNAAYDVAGLGVARQLPVGNGERDGAQVVGNDAHGHVGVVSLAVFLAREA